MRSYAVHYSFWFLNLSPPYGHVILVNGYVVLTGVNNHKMDVQYQICTAAYLA